MGECKSIVHPILFVATSFLWMIPNPRTRRIYFVVSAATRGLILYPTQIFLEVSGSFWKVPVRKGVKQLIKS